MYSPRQIKFEHFFNSWNKEFKQAIATSIELKRFAPVIYGFVVNYGRKGLDGVTDGIPHGFEQFTKGIINDVCNGLSSTFPKACTDGIINEIKSVGNLALEKFVESDAYDEPSSETDVIELLGFGNEPGRRYSDPPIELIDPRGRNR